jgi:ribonuclease P protein component
MVTSQPHPNRFRHRHRLHGRGDFQAVMAAKLRKPVGPVTLCGRANALTHSRLGLSVPKRVGNAVRRNKLKRLLREAFRTQRHHFPAAYDVVVLVKPHEPSPLSEYQQLLQTGVEKIHREAQRRQRRTGNEQPNEQTNV